MKDDTPLSEPSIAISPLVDLQRTMTMATSYFIKTFSEELLLLYLVVEPRGRLETLDLGPIHRSVELLDQNLRSFRTYRKKVSVGVTMCVCVCVCVCGYVRVCGYLCV